MPALQTHDYLTPVRGKRQIKSRQFKDCEMHNIIDRQVTNNSRCFKTVQCKSELFKTHSQGLFQQFWEKAPGQNWEKKIDLTSKLGEINDIEHYKGSEIYSQNQVILDIIMPSIPLKH